jgi:hypothetical protein
MRHSSQPSGASRREPHDLPSGGNVAAILTAVVLAGAAAVVSLPLIRMGPPTPDEGAMLTGAVKLLRGGIFYRDVAAYPTPGAWYLLAAAMRLAGESVVTARTLTLIALAVTVGLFYLIGRRVLGPRLSFACGVALLAVKFWALPAWIAYLYADVAFVLASGAALAFIVGWQRQRALAFFVAGLLFGAAALCKQTVGICPALMGLAALCAAAAARGDSQASRRLRLFLGVSEPTGRPVSFIAAFVAGSLVMLAIPALYFARHGLAAEMLTASLWRPISGYLPSSGVSYLEMLRWSHFGALPEHAMRGYQPMVLLALLSAGSRADAALRHALSEAHVRLIYSLIPIFLLAPLAHLAWKARSAGRQPATGAQGVEAVTLGIMVGLFASAFPRADYYHVIDVAPAWLLAGFMTVNVVREMARPWWLRQLIVGGAFAAAGLWLAVGALAMGVLWQRSDHFADFPRYGRIRMLRIDADIPIVVHYLRRRLPPGSPLFVLGPEAYYYFLTDHYSPWPYAQVYPGQTGADGGQQLADVIERQRVPYIIRGELWPAGLPSASLYAPALLRYVARNYHEVEVPGTSAVLSRRLAVEQGAKLKLLRRNDLPQDTQPAERLPLKEHPDPRP